MDVCVCIYICGCVFVCVCVFLLFICITKNCVLKRMYKVVGYHIHVCHEYFGVLHITIFNIIITWMCVENNA
jgi:hypothetical protein